MKLRLKPESIYVFLFKDPTKNGERILIKSETLAGLVQNVANQYCSTVMGHCCEECILRVMEAKDSYGRKETLCSVAANDIYSMSKKHLYTILHQLEDATGCGYDMRKGN